jgi:alginate O-acetyltransferase complex protein AlgI
MVFSSVDFLFLFLPAFLLVQMILPWRNLTFVLFSLFFYFIGEGWFIAVVLGSVAMNFAFGVAIDSSPPGARRRRFLSLGVAANLSLLVFFKYAGFLAAQFQVAEMSWIRSIHLPVGISFFTFHALSYLVDVYRNDAMADRSPSRLSLYMLMFPQLIAGPILRYSKIAPQLRQRAVTARHVFHGLTYFLFGLGQKVLIADTVAGVADPWFAHWRELSTPMAWIAVLSYTLQIYFDFGGYSNMAIGLALICGFDFPTNFDYPYISRSITEFWRRWHISLSSWFRDYLYIPLGGNQHGRWRTARNLFTVFVLCGLWHGAAWTFVFWGLYHGLLLVIERVGLRRGLERVPAFLRHAYALLAIAIGWVIFRAESLEQARGILARMFFLVPAGAVPVEQVLTGEQTAALLAGAFFSTPVACNLMRRWVALPEQRPWENNPTPAAYAIGLACAASVFGVSALKVLTGAYSPFIYFRF